MEKGSVIDAQQTLLEHRPDIMTATLRTGLMMPYGEYIRTHEYQKLNRMISAALRSISKPRFRPPYLRHR